MPHPRSNQHGGAGSHRVRDAVQFDRGSGFALQDHIDLRMFPVIVLACVLLDVGQVNRSRKFIPISKRPPSHAAGARYRRQCVQIDDGWYFRTAIQCYGSSALSQLISVGCSGAVGQWGRNRWAGGPTVAMPPAGSAGSKQRQSSLCGGVVRAQAMDLHPPRDGLQAFPPWTARRCQLAGCRLQNAVYPDPTENATRTNDRLISGSKMSRIYPAVKLFQATENRLEH